MLAAHLDQSEAAHVQQGCPVTGEAEQTLFASLYYQVLWAHNRLSQKAHPSA